ncbi:thermonuclease family protein [Natronococcus sp. A-GB7]|uniref:thermonuclease family protein n=1 Tax=Natronococcus sp. A-GB7 TaxID=3037649 RepID=UPI00241FD89B|nr:thermonuclease family protein [Natronococcus sp. A-GB7]MDG5818369.1 thermonuclease family protein [Natronococcus sp. A-GB7]
MAKRRSSHRSFGRRGFLASVVAGLGSLGLSGGTVAQERAWSETELDALSFYSSASQIAPDGESELDDDDTVVVWAEPSAHNFETTDDGPETVIYEDNDIPLVSEDGGVVGIGTADFVSDDNGGFDLDNEEFVLNLFDAKMGGSGTVLWDESHDQFGGLALSNYDSFRQYAANAGYEIEATTDLLDSESLTFPSTASQVGPDGGPLTDSSHVVVWAESTATNVDNDGDEASHLYGDDEEIPLVSRDGDVVGVGTAELLEDGEMTEPNERFALNLLADTIGSSGTVLWDDAHDTFYDSSEFGEFADAIKGEGYEFDAAEDLLAERTAVDELEFFSTASLLDADYEPLTDGSSVAVWAEDTAENEDASEDDTESDGTALVADPIEPGTDSVHTWTFDGVNFEGEVDAITVEYPESASFDGLTNDDVTVELTRQLSDGPDRSEISVKSGDYDGAAATFDLSGSFITDIAGPGSVVIHGVRNPDDETYAATITFEGAEDEASLDLEVSEFAGSRFVDYPDDTAIPLVAVDEGVVGLGAELASDESDVDANREFLVSAWMDRIGGTGTVVYDEGHGQALTLADYSELAGLAEERGFEIEATGDLAADLDGADLAMITTPADSFSTSEHETLAAFVDDGGTLFLHDESNFEGDGTAELNELADTLELSFRFNSDQIVDEANSGFAPFAPRTSAFNASFDFFGGGDERAIDAADAVAIASPASAYAADELDALEAHLADGGALFLLDESEFANEETANLNAIADRLELSFRFNADQVEDNENNAGPEFVPTTANFNDGFDVFDGLGALGLDDADGLVVASPTESFSGSELEALSEFLDNGGALFLLDESDFGGQGEDQFGFDETENLNAIADHLELAFRFNSDQVNDGDEFDITTTNVNTEFDYFDRREDSIGIDFERGETYYGRVVRVFDGDTFEVEFDSEYDFRDVIRHLGIDTAETAPATNESEEWFGIEDLDHLDTWGGEATQFSLDVMAPDAEAGEADVEGRRVAMEFDTIEPLRGNFGRLLMYMHYDPDDFDAGPDGDYSADYNLETVEEGYARVYSSGFSRHDEFAAAEEGALAAGRGVWSAADFDALEAVRNDPVEEVFVPRASSITTSSGPLSADRAPVLASPSAEQDPLGNGNVQPYSAAPLVGVDEDRSVGMVGGVLIDEAYEEDEAVDVDTSGFGNFPLLTNLATYLSDNDGDFLLEGGHAQFDVDGSISLERAQFYLRFVEGIGSRLRQINDVVNTLPEEDEPTAVFLTAPGRAYTDEELAALADYRDAGGAVVLLGSTEASAENRANLDDVAAGLGSDLRLNDDRIVDAESNLADDPELPVTGEFDETFPLFEPVGEMPEPPVEELVVQSEDHEGIEVGDVLGDVVVTGSSEIDGPITIDGDVGGDIVLDGRSRIGELHVAGDVDGTVQLTGNAAVDGDVVIDGAAAGVSLWGNPTIGGDLVVGTLEGDLDERGNPSIGGDVVVDDAEPAMRIV